VGLISTRAGGADESLVAADVLCTKAKRQQQLDVFQLLNFIGSLLRFIDQLLSFIDQLSYFVDQLLDFIDINLS